MWEELEAARVRIEALEREVRTLNDAVRARDDFLASAAHELRNPMSAFVLAIEALLLSAHKHGGVPSALIERLEVLRRNIDRFVQRATTLLDVSRISTGSMRLEVADVDYAAIVRQVVDSLSGQIQQSAAPVRVFAPARISGRSDPGRVEQVFTNLISNAVKYGQGRPISVRIRGTPSNVCIFVRDRGIGISEDDQARIFERFERAVTSREHGGFGVGLWIVRQIVLAMNGSISVRSKPGLGSTFRVQLPRSLDRGVGIDESSGRR